MGLVNPVPAPRCDTSEPSVAMLVIASVSALSADPDLAQQDGYPAWCPQKLTLTCTAGGDIVVVDEDGTSHTIHVDVGVPVTITRPIRTIDESASGAVQVIAEWFDPTGSTAWNEA
jgi:hypothetical protein